MATIAELQQEIETLKAAVLQLCEVAALEHQARIVFEKKQNKITSMPSKESAMPDFLRAYPELRPIFSSL
jgi:hypothetical protein